MFYTRGQTMQWLITLCRHYAVVYISHSVQQAAAAVFSFPHTKSDTRDRRRRRCQTYNIIYKSRSWRRISTPCASPSPSSGGFLNPPYRLLTAQTNSHATRRPSPGPRVRRGPGRPPPHRFRGARARA